MTHIFILESYPLSCCVSILSCFHAGTKRTDEGIVTNGGRVLGVTAKGSDLKEARKNAYAATEWVTFENKYMRHDIGKAIDDVEA